MTWQERLFMGLFVFTILGIFTFIGVLQSGGVGWFMYAFLIPFYASFPLVIFGVAGGLVALAIYLVSFLYCGGFAEYQLARQFSKVSGKSGRGGGSSWSGSGWSSGWSSGSSSSSGSSFSGGGGSFGGGGSSGSW